MMQEKNKGGKVRSFTVMEVQHEEVKLSCLIQNEDQWA